jgi:hypothetical protein
MSVDITVTHDPETPKKRCSLCGLIIHSEYKFGMLDLTEYDKIHNITSSHIGILICHNCHEKILLEAGFVT